MLAETVASARKYLPAPAWLLMVDDSGDLGVRSHLDETYPEFLIQHHDRNLGMAAAVQTGFDLALATSARYVFWLEEDHQLIRDIPVEDAIRALGEDQSLAQMCFSREPCDPSEGTDQLAAVLSHASEHGVTDTHTWHDYLFSMIPCLIPRRVLELGWPAGPIGVGNETGMTLRTREHGYRFGAWGHVGDAPYVRHIGYASRGAAWKL
jgi:hypothetical protein